MSALFDTYISNAQDTELLRNQKYVHSLLHYLVTLEVPNKLIVSRCASEICKKVAY